MIGSIRSYSKKVDTGECYPVVHIPETIEAILEKYPYYYRPLPRRPYEPTKPHTTVYVSKKLYKRWINHLSKDDFNIFMQYAETSRIVYDKNLLLVIKEELSIDGEAVSTYFSFAFGALFCIGGIVYNGHWLFYILPIIFVAGTIFLISRCIKTSVEYIQDRIKYRKSRIRWLFQYLGEIKDYIRRVNEYKIACDKYQKELNEYWENIRNYKINPDVYNIRQAEYRRTGNLILIHDMTYDETLSVNKGRAECFLYEKMLRYNNFPFDIFVNAKITPKKGRTAKLESEGEIHISYFPDFLLLSNTGTDCIYYDIEIDEPYIRSNGEPIHAEYMDATRNNFFYNHNVIVIRFAESQVFENPYECIQYIIDVHNKIISMHIEDINYENCDFKVDRWTKELAKEWSKINYRNSYTPKRLTQSYNIEYEEKSWILLHSSQLNKIEQAKIKSIRTIKWYSKKSLLISMNDDEELYIDISPKATFKLGLNIDPKNLWIETYINEDGIKRHLGYYNYDVILVV